MEHNLCFYSEYSLLACNMISEQSILYKEEIAIFQHSLIYGNHSYES
mgnify:CR=1 FL=1